MALSITEITNMQIKRRIATAKREQAKLRKRARKWANESGLDSWKNHLEFAFVTGYNACQEDIEDAEYKRFIKWK